MKKIMLGTGAAVLAAGLTVVSANAQNLITVDELFPAEGMTHGGDWNITNILTSHIGVDPSGSGLANVLYYDLPAIFAGAQAGDVRITDPWEGNAIGDVIRFDGNGHLIFYSLGDTALGGADISSAAFATIVANPLSNNLTLAEQGNELHGFLNYNPVSGSGPGYVGGGPAGGSPSYMFISDVPEPGTMALAGSGLAALLFIMRLRQSK